MHTLHSILTHYPIVAVQGTLNTEIQSIQLDSRKVQPGDVFVAIRGTVADGHQFIESAIANGAKAIVCEEIPESYHTDIVFVKVENVANALGHMVSAYFGHPSKKMKVVAVTGTNGKTTTATLLYNVFTQLGYKVGLLSTIENIVGEEKADASLTTPDAVSINRWMANMVEAGCLYCFMEASSHAIVQERLAGLQLTGAIFSNISRDHLDYHKTFANYINAKKKLFDDLPKTAFALTNLDDKRGAVMLQNCQAKKYSYALKNMADFKGKLLVNSFEGLCLQLEDTEAWFRLIGEFNAYNLLAVYAAGRLLDEPQEALLGTLTQMKPARGRFEQVPAPYQIIALVDYAHTPDALQNVLETIDEVRQPGQRIITVVGCGGDRDKGKRPLMAKVAVEMSDLVWLTSDNPRSEDPEQIIEEMQAGIPMGKDTGVSRVVNRREAITQACQAASPGDVILVAGKGHETYQEINGKRFPFDDKQVLHQAFASLYPKQNSQSSIKKTPEL